MPSGTQVASLFGVLSLVDNMTPGLQSAMRGVERFGAGIRRHLTGGLEALGGQMTDLGRSLTTLTAPLLGFGAAGLAAASDFEQVMVQLQTFGGLAGEELEAVEQAAMQMGAETMFSASDAANAMLELVKAGQSVDQAMISTRAALDLAAVGEMNMAEAAGVIATSMAQFGLDATEAANITDTLARAASASRSDVRGLADGLANVGPVAELFGMTLEETAAVLSVFSNAGIDGAEAGTQLRSMLLNMHRETEDVQNAWDQLNIALYDAQGNARPLNDIIVDMNAAMAGMPAEEVNGYLQTLGGSYGIVGLSALMAAGGTDAMNEAMAGAPDAASLAEAQMGTFAGAVDSLKGSVETLMIEALTPFMENTLQPMVGQLTEVINGVTEWAAENPELAGQLVQIGALAAVAGPVLLVLGQVIGALGTILGVVLSPLGLLVIALGGLVAISGNADLILGELGAAFEDLGGFISALTSGDSAGALTALGDALQHVVNAGGGLVGGLADQVITGLEGITGVDFPTVQEGLEGWRVAFDSIGQLFQIIGQNIEAFLRPAIDWITLTAIPAVEQAFSDFQTGFIDPLITTLGGIWTSVQTGIGNFVSGIEGAMQGVRDFLQPVIDLVNQLLAALGQVRAQTAEDLAVGSAAPQLGAGGLISAPGSALGGAVQAGNPYLVGERGPELFIPDSYGSVEPLGRGGGPSMTVHLTSYGSSAVDLLDLIERTARQRGYSVQ